MTKSLTVLISRVPRNYPSIFRMGFCCIVMVIIPGCAFQEKVLIPADHPQLPVPTENEQHLKREVARLEKLVAQKDQLIKNQKVRQIDQANVIRETNKEATRTQVKSHRLATKPGTASAIAELEASLQQLKQERNAPFDRILRMQAQHLFETATLLYSKDQYADAMGYVGQANNFVKSLQSNPASKKTSQSDHLQLDFHVPMRIRLNKIVKLYKASDSQSQVISSLKKDTVLTTVASQGTWLKVSIEKKQGWIQNTDFQLE
ncbi:MAG TPA: SH3 domain-containing protein [Nitrosomonas sp.]|nr:SH3 domain-containing protein [Nitrosomonas sp.]HQX13426.1 SH3 domain-containing protein [Nitrosomonas sp.]HRB44713.1 SH3 domain-containing protein [Nitrosomonas sp.]